MTRHDLIEDDVLTWRGRDRERHSVTLPGLLAALSSGDVVDFPRARAHQQQPWSMFLTQLAAIALKRAGRSSLPEKEEAWRDMLLSLTNGEHEPWCLLVEDLAKPAFFQPPVPEGTLDGWKRQSSPDDIDIFVTAKNHDVKTQLIHAGQKEAWALSLCSLQTTQGYPSPRHRQIARMNGGYGNRPRVGLSPEPTYGARFRRDAGVLLDSWLELVERGLSDRGVALVWLVPWDGDAMLPLTKLAPHFIEVCARVRLAYADADGLACLYTTSRARRCAPEIDGGDVGDPWIPIKHDGKALTIGPRGYHYGLLVDVLFGGDFSRAPAQEMREDDGDTVLLWASALARGQGKTEGLHERLLPFNPRVRRAFLDEKVRETLGQRARDRVQDAGTMRTKVLFPALKRIALGAETPPDSFDRRVDERFFDVLFASMDEDAYEARAAWQDELAEIARDELAKAIERTSLPDARRYRLQSEAERMFYGCLRKQFPDVIARRDANRGRSRNQKETAQ